MVSQLISNLMDNSKKKDTINGINKEKEKLLKSNGNDNKFPLHAFPKSIQEIISETNDKLKFKTLN